MTAILNHYSKKITLSCLLNLSVTSEGFMCEVNEKKASTAEIFACLQKAGFKASLVGRIIMVTLSSFTVFDETAENK